jgi:uncharacterized membrane protein
MSKFTDAVKLYAGDVVTFSGQHGKFSACVIAFVVGLAVGHFV